MFSQESVCLLTGLGVRYLILPAILPRGGGDTLSKTGWGYPPCPPHPPPREWIALGQVILRAVCFSVVSHRRTFFSTFFSENGNFQFPCVFL